jgi:hypothetical protein
MASADQNQLIADLSRDIIMSIAPQELPLFRATSTAYFQKPDALFKNAKEKDQILGFGIGETVVMMTPSALIIVTQIVQFITAELQKSVVAESSSLIADLVKKKFKKFRPIDSKSDAQIPAPLTKEQLVYVRQLAYKEANRLMRSDTKAQVLADAIVGSLATSDVP